jgi:hypothetical protein
MNVNRRVPFLNYVAYEQPVGLIHVHVDHPITDHITYRSNALPYTHLLRFNKNQTSRHVFSPSLTKMKSFVWFPDEVL